jgi:hypothetical protein
MKKICLFLAILLCFLFAGCDKNKNEDIRISEFCGDKVREPVGKDYLEIETLEGTHIASPGDYIIKGIKGEFYPCKPDIFRMTYEPAD